MNFTDDVIAAVTGHMNTDHPADNLLIARAFGYPDASAATMLGLDARAGTWQVTDAGGVHALTVPWPGGEVTERPHLRREVVALYTTACERLGVQPRDQHPPAAPAQEPEFAQRMRESTWGDHEDSEGATFMADLLRGKGTLEDYTQLVVQHWFMYDALEDAAQQLAENDELALMHPAALLRRETLERDLEHLVGTDWRSRIRAVPATAEYAARIREVAAARWLPGIIAHHYTRYLGDIAGGQLIAKRMAAQFNFDGDGVAFYDFSELGDLGGFRGTYRAALDAFGARLDATEQQRMLDEVRRAYQYNTAVFVDLDRERTGA